MNTAGYYRRFLRYSYQAVSHKSPQKLVAKNYIRAKFTDPDLVPDSQCLANTLQFVQAAGQWTGLENRTVQTIIHVEYSKYKQSKRNAPVAAKKHKTKQQIMEFNDNLYQGVLDGLNKSMNLCL